MSWQVLDGHRHVSQPRPPRSTVNFTLPTAASKALESHEGRSPPVHLQEDVADVGLPAGPPARAGSPRAARTLRVVRVRVLPPDAPVPDAARASSGRRR